MDTAMDSYWSARAILGLQGSIVNAHGLAGLKRRRGELPSGQRDIWKPRQLAAAKRVASYVGGCSPGAYVSGQRFVCVFAAVLLTPL